VEKELGGLNMLVSQLGSYYSDLGSDFLDCLPTTCPECGSPIEITEALTQLRCTNPVCAVKIAQRLVALASSIGVKDMGPARALKFVRHFNLRNPLAIYAYEPDEDGQMAPDINMDISKSIASQFQARKTFTLAEYVRAANLPYIQGSVFQLFEGYDDIDEAYARIKSEGVDYIREKLGISGDNEISIRATKVYESLMTFEDDLKSCIGSVIIQKIHTDDMKVIRAVCSSEVGSGFRTKADFYATCNNKYPNIHIEFGNSVTKSTDYLVWAGVEDTQTPVTGKAKKAMKYQEAGCPIEIVSARQFIDVLDKLGKSRRG